MPGRALAALLWIALGACAEPRVPDALLDVWRTRAPGYEDRTLEVRADSVVFGTGGQATTSHPLTGVELETTPDGRVLCVLHYDLHGEGEAELRLMLDPRPPGTLHLENRKEVWQRQKDATWLARRTTE